MREARFLGGSGGMPPQKFLNFRCSEIASGAIWVLNDVHITMLILEKKLSEGEKAD